MKNKSIIFAKRNLKESFRDPIIYIFCIAFPVVMLLLFVIINKFTSGKTPVFLLKSLVPGIMMFSYSFVMLLMSLTISKDRESAFLKRLFTSPIKPKDFIIGYALPAFIIGIIQSVLCVVFGFIVAVITGEGYFSLFRAVLLILSQMPVLLIFVFLGILFGSILSDKSAPGVSSIFISLSGIIGGAWMPLETMGDFETFCRFFPFYPSVYLGRIITGATKTLNPMNEHFCAYSFDNIAKLGIIPVAVFLALSVVFSVCVFKKQMKDEK